MVNETNVKQEIANSLRGNGEVLHDCKLLLQEFIDSGKTEFVIEFEEFGEKFENRIDVSDVLRDYGMFSAQQAVYEFMDGDIDYDQFLTGYYPHIASQIYARQTNVFSKAILSADLSLILMFSLVYFPSESDGLGEQLLRFMKYHKDLEHENQYYKGKMTEMFGYSDVVWLTSELAKYQGKEALGKEIEKYCHTKIHPAYKNAMTIILSDDQKEINTLIDDLINFHVENSRSDLTLPFNFKEWQFFPIEVIALLELRVANGKALDFIENSFLKEFTPFLGKVTPLNLGEFELKLREKMR